MLNFMLEILLLLLKFLMLLLIFLLTVKFLTLLLLATELEGMRPGNEKFDIKFIRLLPHKFL